MIGEVGVESVDAIGTILLVGLNMGIFTRLGSFKARLGAVEKGAACREHCRAMKPGAGMII